MGDPRKPRRGLDWQTAYARLDRVARALAEVEAPSPELRQRILAERARDLAKPAAAEPPGDRLELLAFPAGGERYAVDAASVVEVAPLRGLTRLPGAPVPFVGIVHHRGRLVPVLDLRRLTGSAIVAGAASRAVVVEVGDAVLGLASDGAAELIGVPRAALEPPAAREREEPFVRALTGDAIAILDLGALASDPRLATTGLD